MFSNSIRAFSIWLDNGSMKYFPGQLITGKIILELNKERKTNGVTLKFLGKAAVSWTESRTVTNGPGGHGGTHTENVTYTEQESYIDWEAYILGGTGEQFTMQPGYQEFPIVFQLPLGIPPSFDGSCGKIYYEISATIKKSSGFEKTVSLPFVVIAVLDLNNFSANEKPILLTKDKYLGCLCCKDGPVSFVFKLSSAGFVPGETLDFIVEINNQSNKTLPRIFVELKQNVSYYARGNSKRESVSIMKIMGPSVGPHQTEIWRSNSNISMIPAVAPSLLDSKLIYFSYSVHVELEIPRAFNLVDQGSILIGTTPFRTKFSEIPGFSKLKSPSTDH